MKNFTKNYSLTYKAIVFAILTVWKCSCTLFIIMCTISAMQGFNPLITAYISKYLLDALVEAFQKMAGISGYIPVCQILSIQLIVLICFSAMSRFSEYIGGCLGAKLSVSMTHEVLTRISKFDCILFEDHEIYNKISRAMDESGGKPLYIIERGMECIRRFITFISLGIVIISFSLPLLVSILLLCLPYLFVQSGYGKRFYKLQYNRTHDFRMSNYLSNIMIGKKVIPEIISFNLWKFLLSRWSGYAESFRKQDQDLNRQRLISLTSVELLMLFGRTVASGYIIYVGLHMNAKMSIGEIMMYIGILSAIISSLGGCFDNISEIYRNSLFLANLFEFNKIKSIMTSKKSDLEAPDFISSIEMRDVFFKYPGRNDYALENINLTFNNSETTLVVGCNGAGKSTLIKLLARLYDPEKGMILLNGIDLKKYNIDSLRKKIGVIFQNYIQYAFSARENIGCGNLQVINDTTQIIKYAKIAKADDFIKKLPLEYETILSKEFNGQELSIGQWQRICLARLFIKDASLLMFDEPTASVDVESEAYLLREITNLVYNKICILVSHRLFKKGIVNRVIVLENGKVIEDGTPGELLNQGGRYYELSQLYHGYE